MSDPLPLRPDVEVLTPPARFAPWPDAIRQRCQELWSTVGGRNCAAVHQLLQAELPGAPVPAAATIRTWASEEDWGAAADVELEATRGRTVRSLQSGWLTALEMAQATLLAGMSGLLDSSPYGGAARIKSAELVLRTLERAGMLAQLPDPLPPSEDAMKGLSEKEKSRRNRDAIAEDKRRKEERRGH